MPKQVEQAARSGVVVVVRMSGRPQPWAAAAPPESKAPIDPTAANAPAHAFV